MYLTVNVVEVPDTCSFIASFEHSLKFCDKAWADMQLVQVPSEIQQAYPQFITIPELYKNDEEKSAIVPLYNCDEMWNNSQVCCVRQN